MTAIAARSIATAGFALAVAVGLMGAFVGFDTYGFWFDELYTAWIVEPSIDVAQLMSRIVADTHPPLYYLAIHFYAKLFGDTEAGLRSFSAICAGAAVLLFMTATGRSFSLNARLFGAGIATGSLFWFHQAQNARSYALCLLIGAAIMTVCLSLSTDRRERDGSGRKYAALAALMLTGSFVHFYLTFVSLAVLIVLWLHRPKNWHWPAGLAVLLIAATALYVKLVVGRYSYTAVDRFWMANDFAYYRFMLTAVVVLAFGKLGSAAIGLCLASGLWGRFSAKRDTGREPTEPILRLAAMTLGVPAIVLVGAVVSSSLLSPNFSERNFLICAPFLWGACALIYDWAGARLRNGARIALDGVLVAVVLAMSLIVRERLVPEHGVLLWRESFRQSADLIRTFPDCRGELIPVLTTDKEGWYKRGYADVIYREIYGRYLKGFAVPTVLFTDDVVTDKIPGRIAEALQRRIGGEGCPVLVWSVHNSPGDDEMTVLIDRLLAAAGRPSAGPSLHMTEFRDGRFGFVLHVRRKIGG